MVRNGEKCCGDQCRSYTVFTFEGIRGKKQGERIDLPTRKTCHVGILQLITVHNDTMISLFGCKKIILHARAIHVNKKMFNEYSFL